MIGDKLIFSYFRYDLQWNELFDIVKCGKFDAKDILSDSKSG